VLAVSHHIVAEGREASDVSQRLTLLRRFYIGVPSYLSAQDLLDGEYRFTIGDEEFVAGCRRTGLIPRRAPHRFTVGSDGGRWVVGQFEGHAASWPSFVRTVIKLTHYRAVPDERDELNPEFWSRLGAELHTRFLEEDQVDAATSPAGLAVATGRASRSSGRAHGWWCSPQASRQSARSR
jgi:hypothetical protein